MHNASCTMPYITENVQVTLPTRLDVAPVFIGTEQLVVFWCWCYGVDSHWPTMPICLHVQVRVCDAEPRVISQYTSKYCCSTFWPSLRFLPFAGWPALYLSLCRRCQKTWSTSTRTSNSTMSKCARPGSCRSEQRWCLFSQVRQEIYRTGRFLGFRQSASPLLSERAAL